MFSPVGIRASHSVLPADDKELTMSDTSGRTYGKQFATYDPDTRSWRMWPATGLWGSIEFSETWPRTGCMSDGQAFELPTSVHPITANGSSSSSHFPTPKACDGIMGRPRTSGRPIEKSTHLGTIVTVLPTPVAQPSGNSPEVHLRKKPGRTQVTDLSIIVENGLLESGGKVLPSPKASDATGGGQHPDRRKGHTQQLVDAVLGLTGVPTLPLFDVGSD